MAAPDIAGKVGFPSSVEELCCAGPLAAILGFFIGVLTGNVLRALAVGFFAGLVLVVYLCLMANGLG
jgi:hypothetical protein